MAIYDMFFRKATPPAETATTTTATTTATAANPSAVEPSEKKIPEIVPAQKCTICGEPYPSTAVGSDAQKRIGGLETQVKSLTEKASTAVDKLADYEDELSRLRLAQKKHEAEQSRRDSEATTDSAVTTSTTATAPAATGFFGFMRNTPSPAPAASATTTVAAAPSSPKEIELAAALAKEQDLRKQAETKVSSLSSEMEELSVQLFQQANEMVAAERKARAKLEERVKILEMREEEKRVRLDRLEKAVRRADRVRSFLAAGG